MKETVHLTADHIVQVIKDNSDFIQYHKMSSMPYGSCNIGMVKVEDKTGEALYIIFLKSYSTVVCGYVLDDDIVYMFCTGTYSATTAKHISKFVREFTPIFSYYTMKYISTFKSKCAIISGMGMNDPYEMMMSIIKQCDKYTEGEMFGTYR